MDTGFTRPALRGQEKLLDEHRRLHPAALLYSSQDVSKKDGVSVANSSPQESDESSPVVPDDTTHPLLHKTSPSFQDGALGEGSLDKTTGQDEKDEDVEDPSSKFSAFKKVGSMVSCTSLGAWVSDRRNHKRMTYRLCP